MNIQLDHTQLAFNLDSETPFFQVPQSQRMRLSIEHVQPTIFEAIVAQLFGNNHRLNGAVLHQYDGRIEQTAVGKFFSLSHWCEIAHVNQEEVSYTIANFGLVGQHQLVRYFNYVQRSMKNPFVVFYDEHSLIYFSTDVVDIVSGSSERIQQLREQYEDYIDTFYDE
jgi:hypothetical protein